MAPEPPAGNGVPDPAEAWGAGGLVGDGRYRLTHRLGRGGMAEVFAAEDVRLGRTVAVKLLRADLAEDPVSKARFTREAQSVAGLNHHAIVAVYDSGEDVVNGQPVPYIVMELVEGRTIRDLLINADAPPPEQALIIVSGVLEALAYSHQHAIVHRDIKPANVIITHSGAVKVMDFGIARALHGASTTMTQTGMVMGTPQYLSPEQALGKAVDHRSDLYATGCLLYELLALRPPFTGETPLSVVYQHVQDIPVPPSQISDVVPPELDGLVMRSLAKDPDDRFQSAEEMRGLVQYALQMLQQQGSHSGSWDTGYVPARETAPTTALGHGGVGATAVHPIHGETAQGPILPPMNPDDGAYEGGHGGGGRRRGKVWLFAALALVAVVTGVALALNAADTADNDQKSPVKTTQSPERPKEPETKPSQSPERPSKSVNTPDQGNQQTWAPKYPTKPQSPRPTLSEPVQPSPTQSAGESSQPTTPQQPSPSIDPPEGGDPGGPSGDPGGGDPGTGQPGGGESGGETNGEPGGEEPVAP
ncbi:protein kinase domain-containing protein [Streptomyces clavuligerus]|uniref:non-specific serine/threonine protein kinase n=1 Tax=Streptomyces clavuligerus TaxID=1901 RepID=B5GU61_STRCL|nr:protein kinase [Streptomyces clavuligerus]ANW19184.1 serine/threonine protein kinase [Streptomyces clavuligerus]AXU13780.1 serine/threonine protein kinase [Streptomyces clavuligerus]EDY49857.1 serine/threonine protein kinase [Streptomyces clavuligerus]EFG08063.1 Putative serine/threonine protein kinase [Streptomyces clavuligerus]MBY6303745.1 protein kinase [Streptomyces clavuligerus]